MKYLILLALLLAPVAAYAFVPMPSCPYGYTPYWTGIQWQCVPLRP